MIRICLPIPQKIYNITKRLKILQEIEQYFPGFLSFIDSTEQQQMPRPAHKERRKVYYSLGKKKKQTTVKNRIMVNNYRGYILYKVTHKKGRKHGYILNI